MSERDVKQGVFGSYINNPETVDSSIGWLLLITMTVALTVVMSLNLEPYSILISQAMQRSMLLRVASWIPGLTWLIGAFVFVFIQICEILPLMGQSQFESEECDFRKFNSSMMIRVILSIPAFIVDTFLAVKNFPVIRDGITPDQLFLAFNSSMVSWDNLLIVVTTIFGLSAYVIVKRAIARSF